MKHLFKRIIYVLFIIILVYYLYLNYLKNSSKENFISKIKLEKNLIVVMMNGTVSKEYKGTIKTMCNNYIDDCTYNFDENKIDSLKKINITYDNSLKTSTKLKNANYLVIYEDKDPSDSYNKKFIKKWCSKKKKNKNNYIVIDYNNIYKDSSKILDEIEKKFKINIPMKGMLSYDSLNNINIEEIKNIASSVSMNDLAKQFINKI